MPCSIGKAKAFVAESDAPWAIDACSGEGGMTAQPPAMVVGNLEDA
jgi:hypothetical protein